MSLKTKLKYVRNIVIDYISELLPLFATFLCGLVVGAFLVIIYTQKQNDEQKVTIFDTTEIKEYYENGNIKKQYSIADGNIDGVFRVYYEDGMPMIYAVFKDGELDGELILYYEDGKENIKEEYSYGILTRRLEYDRKGRVICDYLYDADGEVFQECA